MADPTSEPVYKTWNQVDKALGQLSLFEAGKAKKKAKKEAQIAKIQAEYDLETNEIDFEINRFKKDITEFTRSRLEEIRKTGKKSVTLNNGTIKTKEADAYEYPSTDELVEKLRELEMFSCISTKATPIKSIIKARAGKDENLFESLGIVVTPEVSIKIETI